MVKTLYILAGGNGAGKTTYYYQFLKGKGIPFVNADEIAKNKYENDLDKDRKAQAEAFELYDQMLTSDNDWCYETVFSHDSKLEFLERAKSHGFKIHLIYITLVNPSLHLERVLKRVSSGGHSVPEDKILSRLQRIPGLMKRAALIVDKFTVLDNSGESFKKVDFKGGDDV